MSDRRRRSVRAHVHRARAPRVLRPRSHALGPRLFGVLTASPRRPGYYGPEALARLEALAPPAAGAIANALDFHRERRVAAALGAGSSPTAPTTSRASRSASSTSPPAMTSAEATSSACGRCPSGALARARRRRHRQGTRSGRAERDGPLLRRGAHLGLRTPRRGADPDRSAAGRPAASASFVITIFIGVIADGTLRGKHRHGRPPSCAPRAKDAQGHQCAPRCGGRRALRLHETPFDDRRRAVRPGPTSSSRRAVTGRSSVTRLAGVLGEHRRTLAPRSSSPYVYPRCERRRRRTSTTTSSCSPCAPCP